MQSPTTDQRPRVRDWILPVLIVATCIRVWLIPGGELLPRAQAQVPDSGMQRLQILNAAQRTNELLGQIVDILGTKAIQVRLVDADNTSKTGGALTDRSQRGRRAQ